METLEQALEKETKYQKWLGFKLFMDVWIHPVMLLIIFYSLVQEEGYIAFCLFYFGLGGYQLLSSIIHLSIPGTFQKRKYYYIQLISYVGMFLLVGLGLIFPFAEGCLVCLLLLLLLTPFSAVYYFIISLNDYQTHKQQKWH
jgi:hypothetical protein